jgi:hypothetical protein
MMIICITGLDVVLGIRAEDDLFRSFPNGLGEACDLEGQETPLDSEALRASSYKSDTVRRHRALDTTRASSITEYRGRVG